MAGPLRGSPWLCTLRAMQGLLGGISPGTLQPLRGAHYPTFQEKAGRSQLATTQCLSGLGLAAPKPCAGSQWPSDSSSLQGP